MAEPPDGEPGSDTTPETEAELRRRVEEEYDFDDFGPADMAEMTAEEWEVTFDPETWITGAELLDRVEQDLAARVERRDVFAQVERERNPDLGEERLVAYSDEGYAAVYEDGSVEGEGTVLRDVKPSVALCSMEDYEVPEPAGDGTLPEPEEVPQGTGDLGNKVLLAVGAVQFFAGVALLGAWAVLALPLVAPVAGLGFTAFGLLLLFVVANARLSDRFRSEEFRDRLRDAGGDDRPAFAPDRDEDNRET
jgi:hypothetical protein